MTTTRPESRLSAARHPAIRGLANAVLVVPGAAVVGAVAALFLVLDEPLPVFEKVLWTALLLGVAVVAFLVGWYLSLLGHAVAELGEARSPEPRP
jgi:hypothetical protein